MAKLFTIGIIEKYQDVPNYRFDLDTTMVAMIP